MGGHLLAPYPAMGYRREVVAYFISKVFQNLYSKISFQPHAFFFAQTVKPLNTKNYEEIILISCDYGNAIAKLQED